MRISDWSSDVCSSDLKVATPEAVPGVVRQRRKEDALNGGVGAQGFRNLHRGGCLPLKARCQRAEAALSKEAVVGRNAEADRKSVGSGKSVSVSVDTGGRRMLKKKNKRGRS